MSGAGPSFSPGEMPSWSVFKFPPSPDPAPIPPPFAGYSLRTPFPIPAKLFQDSLSYKVPLTIGTVYATTVVLVNQYNKRNGNKPWAISKTRLFKAFVILHNVFLAVYSAVTCIAMVRALTTSFPHYSEPDAFVGTVDALCKINGPRGLGSAATYNEELNIWTNKNRLMQLDNGAPDATDVGRIWNEGLAWWGWVFYMSKFYEVLDTVIILAKGKRSSTLQTYHHTGAMLCMWAGIRYMASPIWVFTVFNSAIHAMMYTYYTISALKIRVPMAVKRSLTTMQIMQFVLGASTAAIFLFISYTVPVSVPYEITEVIISQPTVSAVTSIVTPSPGAAVAFLKKILYRGVGEEGLAENIPVSGNANYAHHDASNQHLHATKLIAQKIVYRTEYQSVPCIDTSGQAFAIYLNLIYLAPLTFLFMRFFVKSYLRRTSSTTKHITKTNAISKSGHDAIHGVEREVESFGKAAEDRVGAGIDMISRGREATTPTKPKRVASLSPDGQSFIESVTRKASQRLEEMGDGEQATRERARKLAKEIVDGVSSTKSERPNQNGASYADIVERPSGDNDLTYAEAAVEPSNEADPSIIVEKPNGNGKSKARGKSRKA